MLRVPSDRVGIVTALDGRPIPQGDLAGPVVLGHDSFQSAQAFIDGGGCRGLQEQVMLSGAWNINPWFAAVELIPLEPLLPGKHPLNTRAMKVELVPTTNIVLNWANRSEAHHYDAGLDSITVRSRDGFSFQLDVSTIIHIGMKNAPRVISRVGSMQNLVDHVLQPTVGNYFRNSAQEVGVLEFLSARSGRQREAYLHIRAAVGGYDVDCIDTLIGDISPPAELMKTQTDRKIAAELQRTYEAQREAQMCRQMLERETATANMQAEIVRSEQAVHIQENTAEAFVATARGQAEATRIHAAASADAVRLAADAEAAATRVRGEALADAERARGGARAASHKAGTAALGEASYTAIQLATIVGDAHLKLVPDVVLGEGRSNLSDVLLARMAVAKTHPAIDAAPPTTNGHAKMEQG